MQLDAATLTRYQQQTPELMDAVDSGEADYIMRRDPNTDYCVKFSDGLCAIHKQYGTDFLGDACHFYPRVTRRVGDRAYMTATLSCPEIARLALFGENGFAHEEAAVDRLPHHLTNYLPSELSEEKALALHQQFILFAGDTNITPERLLARFTSVSHSLQSLAVSSWPEAVHVFYKRADMLLPEPDFIPADPFNLLHALMGLVAASKKCERPRLVQVISDMEKALNVTLDWNSVGIATTDQSLPAYQQMEEQWRDTHAAAMADALRRWIQTQLAVAFFPFAGFGNSLVERMTLISVRFATLKLALMSVASLHGGCTKDDVVRVAQSLSRFLDHLADPALSLAICKETGWLRPARLRALVGDF